MEKFRTAFCSGILLSLCAACGTSANQGSTETIQPEREINVIELRNYLVRPNSAEAFNALFSQHFLAPMRDMGVSIPGRFKIRNNEDHFVWIRGYKNLQQHVKFLNDYYFGDPQWKKYKKDANGLIRNSDNVYLLRPLTKSANSSRLLDNGKPFAAVDFYIANTRLDELTSFFTKDYLPVLQSVGCNPTLWVSETEPNDFPQLPVFQDKNLLVAITFYRNEKEYRAKSKKRDAAVPDAMKTKMLDIVTIHRQILLTSF